MSFYTKAKWVRSVELQEARFEQREHDIREARKAVGSEEDPLVFYEKAWRSDTHVSWLLSVKDVYDMPEQQRGVPNKWRPNPRWVRAALNSIERFCATHSREVTVIRQRMEELNRRMRPSVRHQTARRDVLKQVRAAIASTCPKATVEPYGSYGSGFGSATSDIDLSVSNISAPWNTTVVEQVEKILQAANLQGITLVKSECCPTYRIPILKLQFQHIGTSNIVEVDIVSQNRSAIANTALLRTYNRLDARLLALYRAVKQWIVKNKLYGGSVFRFNSYTVVLIVIHYLQSGVGKPVLPVLPEINWENARDSRRAEWSTMADQWASENTLTVPQLLIGFFAYYGQFDFGQWKLNVTDQFLHSRYVGMMFVAEDRPISMMDPVGSSPPSRSVDFECFQRFKEAANQFNYLVWVRINKMDDASALPQLAKLMGW